MNLGAELNASTCVGAVRLLDVDEVNLLRAENRNFLVISLVL